MFSVLISVYCKENPDNFDGALRSIWTVQTLKPEQIVLVKDGPLTPELDRVVSDWKLKLGQKLTVVLLERNMGLAAALNVGLRYCKNELVARMDTDDISVPVRFEKQMDFMQKNPDVAVSSGLIEEWSQDYSYKVSERRLPLVHEDILRFAKFRSPMSHAAVMYRKSAVLAVGVIREYIQKITLYGGYAC